MVAVLLSLNHITGTVDGYPFIQCLVLENWTSARSPAFEILLVIIPLRTVFLERYHEHQHLDKFELSSQTFRVGNA
jgi:hypothetical protein